MSASLIGRLGILAGHQPGTLQLDDLLKPLPPAWSGQDSALFNPP
jgi:hypothetical protein